MARPDEEIMAGERTYRPPIAPLRYACGDVVRIRHAGPGTSYEATVSAAFVTGENVITPTYVLALEGCDGCVTVTDHNALALVRRGDGTDG